MAGARARLVRATAAARARRAQAPRHHPLAGGVRRGRRRLLAPGSLVVPGAAVTIAAGVAIGYLAHVAADACTPSGVAVSRRCLRGAAGCSPRRPHPDRECPRRSWRRSPPRPCGDPRPRLGAGPGRSSVLVSPLWQRRAEAWSHRRIATFSDHILLPVSLHHGPLPPRCAQFRKPRAAVLRGGVNSSTEEGEAVSRRCLARPSSVLSAALALEAWCRETDSYGRGPSTAPSGSVVRDIRRLWQRRAPRAWSLIVVQRPSVTTSSSPRRPDRASLVEKGHSDSAAHSSSRSLPQSVRVRCSTPGPPYG